jgi:hypoxanthine phosphoribosyltransferase
VAGLARQLRDEYSDRELLLVGLLKGALPFMIDLARSLSRQVEMDFMAVSSYGASTRSSGIVRIVKDLGVSLEGRHVLVVEDIVDSGRTLAYVLEMLRARQPASVRVCALLSKPSRRETNVQLDYVGFDIPDVFVVGYGLDFAERYRNLPFIGILPPHYYS